LNKIIAEQDKDKRQTLISKLLFNEVSSETSGIVNTYGKNLPEDDKINNDKINNALDEMTTLTLDEMTTLTPTRPPASDPNKASPRNKQINKNKGDANESSGD